MKKDFFLWSYLCNFRTPKYSCVTPEPEYIRLPFCVWHECSRFFRNVGACLLHVRGVTSQNTALLTFTAARTETTIPEAMFICLFVCLFIHLFQESAAEHVSWWRPPATRSLRRSDQPKLQNCISIQYRRNWRVPEYPQWPQLHRAESHDFGGYCAYLSFVAALRGGIKKRTHKIVQLVSWFSQCSFKLKPGEKNIWSDLLQKRVR